MELEALKALRATKVAEMESLINASKADERELTDEEQTQFDALNAECGKLANQISVEETMAKRKAEVARSVKLPVLDRIVPPQKPADISPEGKIQIPATVKKWGQLKSFKGPDADIQAFTAGQFYRALYGSQNAQRWCSEHGVMLRLDAAAHQEDVNTRGGYLVYDELDNAIIDLRLQYGVFERNARRVAMTSDVKNRPRRTGGLAAYWVGESTAVTESNKTWDKVQLIAKKLGVIARISNELSEDAIINVADDLTREISAAFAQEIDEAGFIGTGASTYGGIYGLSPLLSATNGVDEGGGMILAAGNLFSEATLGDLSRMIGKLPNYAIGNAKWYCSQAVWGSVLLRLATAVGGATVTEVVNGVSARSFLGFPVELTEVLPTADGNSQIFMLFGDLSLSSDFGDRRSTTVKFSDSAYVGSTSVFEQDETAVIGTIRCDINNHDIGTSTAAGPVVCLISAAS